MAFPIYCSLLLRWELRGWLFLRRPNCWASTLRWLLVFMLETLTSTPGLAASLQTLNDPTISVGYGIAYPLGVIGVVVFVQLAPRALGINWKEENRAFNFRQWTARDRIGMAADH